MIASGSSGVDDTVLSSAIVEGTATTLAGPVDPGEACADESNQHDE